MPRKLRLGKRIPFGVCRHIGKNLGEDGNQKIDNQYSTDTDNGTAKPWYSNSRINFALSRLHNALLFSTICFRS